MWEWIISILKYFVINYGLQIGSTIGLIYLSGVIIYLLRRLFLFAGGRWGNILNLATSVVGTPIHESAHALFCLIFGHRVTAFKPFKPDPKNGTLGYVNHEWNDDNVYNNSIKID